MENKKSVKTSTVSKIKTVRPPIVTILGHVDHGKTTLLDYVRKTDIAKKEAGGITQKIGASVITTTNGNRITFIDTPGHEAFSKMRSRGAEVADIAVLVVAANDGVKPQTKEAISFIKEAKIPYIVAMTKVDLPAVSVSDAKTQLEKEGVSFEGSGGEVPLVEVSGKTGKGVDELLEVISLLYEVKVEGDLSEDAFEGVVIETDKDRSGLLVSILIRKGELKVTDVIAAGGVTAKVRGMFDDTGKSIAQVSAGEPALILGFSTLPQVGSKVYMFSDNVFESKKREEGKSGDLKTIKEGDIPVVIKAATAGGLEAVLGKIPKNIYVIASGVGDVTENDVFMAKSSEGGRIFAFESKIPNSVKNLAETDGIKVESYKIIYELIEKLEKLVEEDVAETLGKAMVIATFPFNGKKVAGCKIVSGEFKKGGKFVLERDDKKKGEVKITSMRKGKQEIDSAKSGEELGILFYPQLDFQIGDMILSIR